MAIIGIDLGTTNSLGAVFRNNKVELIPNRFGSFLTPSVVSLAEDGTILVGEVAKERLITHPETTIASFKKDMGTEKRFHMGNAYFTPEELSSFVIRSIVEDAKNYLQEEIEEVVISVPAYFHDRQRVATKRAGTLAGVTVNRIINEPSAAAMASYFDTSREQLFLIFDFGGGTLDVSIVECFDTMIEVISVSGDNRLGGDDFHTIMADNFMQEHNLSRQGVGEKGYAILLKQAEFCKRQLTDKPSAVMVLNVGEQTYQSVYTNERLLEESAKLLGRVKSVTAHALRDGELSIGDLDAVVMVGGSSKMPLMQSYLSHLFKNIPVITSNSDEMIARGLGLVCGVKERNEEIRDYVLTDICPFTLGISKINHANPEHCLMAPIIERNTVLPCSRVAPFRTVSDNQTKLCFDILQGEHIHAEDNMKLSEMEIPVRREKAGKESIQVRFTYDINGILVVDVTVDSTGQTFSKVISQNINEKEIQRKLDELQKLKVHPKDISENVLIMEKLKSLYEESAPREREYIKELIMQFEQCLNQQNGRKIAKYRKFLECVIPQLEFYDPFGTPIQFEEFKESEDESEEEQEDDSWNRSDGGGTIWTS